MKHTEHQYIDLGYRFEKASAMSPSWAMSLASQIRHLLESERIPDRTEARFLIERGRQEARSQ